MTDSQLRSYLRQTRKSDLIAWLIEQCEEDERLRASLLDLVTPREQAAALAGEIRARIRRAWQLSKQRDGWGMALPISRELDEVLVSIRGLVDKGCLAEAEKLLVAFVQAAEKGIANIDDSYAYLWPTCQEGVTVWGEVCARVEPRDPKQLADFVYEQINDNSYAIKDHMISKFAGALGEDGLRSLQWRLKGDLAALPQPKPDTRLPNIKRVEIVAWLLEVADALADVDEYIAICGAERQTQSHALPIARRLFEAGRLEETLAFLEKADPGRRFFHDEEYDYATLKTETLIRLGRPEEAEQTLWQEFAAYLEMSTFEKILRLTPDEQRGKAHNKAVSLVEGHRSPEHGLYFLVRVNEPELAAQMVQRRQGEISGSSYDILLEVTEALAGPHPSEAWILYKILLLDILDNGRYKAYHHAADYFTCMERLSKRACIEHEQAEFVQTLRQKHGRKRSFWARVEEDP